MNFGPYSLLQHLVKLIVKTEQPRVLIMGVSGMLGSCLYSFFSSIRKYDLYGTYRRQLIDPTPQYFLDNQDRLIKFEMANLNDLDQIIDSIRPNIVINCIGLVKQIDRADGGISAIISNALFPHQLYSVCQKYQSRMIHFSTDCVFSGARGLYSEIDIPDARDLYGLSKLLGEVNGKDCITIRTSIIGHELYTSHSLMDWFLSQSGEVVGFKNAIFSGLPTIEIAKIIDKYVIPDNSLNGLYHLSSEPISKFDLLKLVDVVYGVNRTISSSPEPKIDRSLDSGLFRARTGFEPDTWPAMIQSMHENYEKYTKFRS